ncbi:translation initiation factor [Synechococcus sp. MIT S9503]|uniref:translation initiation factor n=1 Tax=Synechococcus sp. MIT S9503 TaxID=3082547 RepID=UPI0039A40BDE
MPKGGWQEFSTTDSLQRPSGMEKQPIAKAEQTVRVQPTRGGKGGKTVTVIRGLELDPGGLKALLKKLKTRIGSGGTTRNGLIELQGDQVEIALDLLSKEGYRPKRAGG